MPTRQRPLSASSMHGVRFSDEEWGPISGSRGGGGEGEGGGQGVEGGAGAQADDNGGAGTPTGAHGDVWDVGWCVCVSCVYVYVCE